MSVLGYVRATHLAPTLAVTTVVTLTGWSLGWRGVGLAGVAAAVITGQLSVGWSNDAYDAELDARARRTEKPTVAGKVTARALWVVALVAIVVSAALSWWVAGWVGGSFHVAAVMMAWVYNTLLSRTLWSWLPYAVSFGCAPPFLTYGLTGTPPAPWLLVVYPIVGVSAHLANALPDLESDRAVGLDGAVIRLGARRSTVLGWLLLGVGSAVLAMVASRTSWPLAAAVALGYVMALAYAVLATSRAAMFHGLIAAVLVDVVVLVVVAY